MQLVHQSLPERGLDQVDLSTTLAGLQLPNPVIINAMTGGAIEVGEINRDLAAVAAELGLAMAVGSQTAGIREPEVAETYRVVRTTNPRGLVFANLSADATVDLAQRAVEMVAADLIQIHLNAPQELVMAEGDRGFRGRLANIALLVRVLPVPVLVKECGFGLSREAARALYDVGVRAVDISGRGGTNFAWIEAQRSGEQLDPGLLEWGIPTPCALAEVAHLALPGLDIVASGGIRFGSEAAKAVALGARAVAVAGAVLRHHQRGGRAGALAYLQGLLRDLSRVIVLTGSATLAELGRCPVVVGGETGQWCQLRGIELQALARRGSFS